MRRKRGNGCERRVVIVWREPTWTELLAEWARRREQCRADIEEAKRRGDLTAYRELKRRWACFYAKDYYRDEGPPPAT
jgi:hypothetical protein